LVGIAFTSFLSFGMSSFSGAIRSMQLSGTLEAMLSTPTRLPTILVGSSVWSYIFTAVNVAVYFLVGVLLFGLELDVNLVPAALIFVLTLICFSSIGIISAGVILVLKKGNPFSFLVSNLFGLLGGMLYPITIMPGWLQAVAAFLPVTYSLKGMRLALLQGSSLQSLWPDIIALVAFSLVLFPAGLMVFSLALKKAKKDGSLIKY
jgi:ABC-2 type transport system permease protein